MPAICYNKSKGRKEEEEATTVATTNENNNNPFQLCKYKNRLLTIKKENSVIHNIDSVIDDHKRHQITKLFGETPDQVNAKSVVGKTR